MRVTAVVEVVPDGDGVPVGLVRAAYLASQSGPVLLVLSGIPGRAIDAALDPIVRAMACGQVRGVAYVESVNDEAMAAAATATLVIAASDTFRERLRARGIAFVAPESSYPRLESLAQWRSAFQPASVTPPTAHRSLATAPHRFFAIDHSIGAVERLA